MQFREIQSLVFVKAEYLLECVTRKAITNIYFWVWSVARFSGDTLPSRICYFTTPSITSST